MVLSMTMIGALWVRVPFVPTSHRTAQTMLNLAALRPGETLYDLGAGDARLLIYAKRQIPTIRAIGYEIVPAVWLLGKIRILLSRQDVQLRFCNALKADLRDADCIVLYLITDVMPKFAAKFQRELKPGTRVISHAFPLPGYTPMETVAVPGLCGGKSRVYVYKW